MKKFFLVLLLAVSAACMAAQVAFAADIVLVFVIRIIRFIRG